MIKNCKYIFDNILKIFDIEYFDLYYLILSTRLKDLNFKISSIN